MEAESLFQSAEKKVNRFFFADYGGAEELYIKAATRFKVDKNYARAGEAYMRAAECATKSGDAYSSGQCFADAVNVYKMVDMSKAALALERAVAIQIDTNRLAGAARLEVEFADALCEHGSSMDAIVHYERALQFFRAEDQKSQVVKCMVAMAKVYGENDKFDQALTYYERVANEMLSGPLRFQAQDYFVRCMLCRFAMVQNDNRHEKSEECLEALAHYLATDIHLNGTREAEFLQLLLEAVTDSDMEKFEQAVSLLQSLRKLDEWKTHVLLVVKHNMESLT